MAEDLSFVAVGVTDDRSDQDEIVWGGSPGDRNRFRLHYASPPMDVSSLKELAADRYSEFVDALREMVNVDCGSYTPDGVNVIIDLCQARVRGGGGWAVERVRHEPDEGQEQLGDLVIGRLVGSGSKRVLMIGHTDTVFDPGTVAERPFATQGDRAFGPGVTDMKGGLLTGFFAVESCRRRASRTSAGSRYAQPGRRDRFPLVARDDPRRGGAGRRGVGAGGRGVRRRHRLLT